MDSEGSLWDGFDMHMLDRPPVDEPSKGPEEEENSDLENLELEMREEIKNIPEVDEDLLAEQI